MTEWELLLVGAAVSVWLARGVEQRRPRGPSRLRLVTLFLLVLYVAGSLGGRLLTLLGRAS